jgi:methanogenic corrinoid protein MtbC1
MPRSDDFEAFASELRASLAARLVERDRHGAIELALAAVADGSLTVPEMHTQVLGPLLVEIGSAWQHGTERVWQEHLASHTVATIVEALYPTVIAQLADVERIGQSVVLACPPKEQHELGLRMLADRFELAGYDVTYVGADTPLAEIVAAAKATRADLVALSISTVYERVEFRCFIDSLREHLPAVRITVGGPAFTHPRGIPAHGPIDPAELGLPGSPREG